MKKLRKDEVKELQARIDLAFDVIEDLVKHPEKAESLPNNAILIPIPIKMKEQST